MHFQQRKKCCQNALGEPAARFHAIMETLTQAHSAHSAADTDLSKAGEDEFTEVPSDQACQHI